MNQRTIYYGSIGTALFLSSGMLIASVNSYANEATTPGKYTVTYEVDGKIETATITVKENQTELKLKDTFLGVNQAWSPLDNVVFLKDKEGRPLNLENVIIENNVNTQKVGLYFVTFRTSHTFLLRRCMSTLLILLQRGICLQSFLIVKQ